MSISLSILKLSAADLLQAIIDTDRNNMDASDLRIRLRYATVMIKTLEYVIAKTPDDLQRIDRINTYITYLVGNYIRVDEPANINIFAFFQDGFNIPEYVSGGYEIIVQNSTTGNIEKTPYVPTSCNNGLTGTDGIIQLGGQLIKNTQINTLNYQLRLGDLVSANALLDIMPGNHMIQAQVNTSDGTSSGVSITSDGLTFYYSPPTAGISRLDIASNYMLVTDSYRNVGFLYDGDYFANGSTNPRWIPDIGAVNRSITTAIEAIPPPDLSRYALLDGGSGIQVFNGRQQFNAPIVIPNGGGIYFENPSFSSNISLLANISSSNKTQYLQDKDGVVALLSDLTSSGYGTVGSVSIVTANGISGMVANSNTTPAITLTLGDIMPTSVVTGNINATSVNANGINGLSGNATLNLGAYNNRNGINLIGALGSTIATFNDQNSSADVKGITLYQPINLSGYATTALQPLAYGQFMDWNNGLNWKHSVLASTTGSLPSYSVSGDFLTLTSIANGPFPTQDGVTIPLNERTLVKNEVGLLRINNGGYVLTQVGDSSHPWILTRMPDSNTSSLLQAATYKIREGATQAFEVYSINVDPIILGTTQITFALTGGPGTYLADEVSLHLSANVLSFNSSWGDARYLNLNTGATVVNVNSAVAFNYGIDVSSSLIYLGVVAGSNPLLYNGGGYLRNSPNIYVSGNSLSIGSAIPHPSAALSIQSNTQGVLLPQMLASDRAAISLAPGGFLAGSGYGLMVYQTDGAYGTYINLNADGWQKMLTAKDLISPSVGNLSVIGADGSGVITLTKQSAVPATPATDHQIFYLDTSGRFSFMGSTGFSATLTKAALTASQVYSFPNATGTFSLLEASQTWGGINTFSNATNSAIFSGGQTQFNGNSTTSLVKLCNANSAGYSSIDFYDSGNTLKMALGYANSSASGSAIQGNNYLLSATPLLFTSSNTNELWRSTTAGILMPSTGGAFRKYNTVIDPTNFEYLNIGVSGNIFGISAASGGTGVVRPIQITNGGSIISLDGVGSTILPNSKMSFAVGSTAGGGVGSFANFAYTGTMTSASGMQSFYSLNPTINQSSTAGYRALWIPIFEQALGSGNAEFINVGLTTAFSGGIFTSKWKVDRLGNSTQTGSILSTGLTLNLGSDATGDLYYRNSSGAFVRLPIGTSGQTLKVSAGLLPAWV